MLSTVIAILSIVLLAVAATPGGYPPPPPPPKPPGDHNNQQCYGGTIQCCNTIQEVDHPGVAGLLTLLGVATQPGSQIGLGCDPVAVIGINQGTNCVNQVVCCQDNDFNGLINIGCSPIFL